MSRTSCDAGPEKLGATKKQHQKLRVNDEHTTEQQPVMNFEDIEDQDGVRFTLNSFPSSPNEATKAIVPLASLYKPLQRSPQEHGLPVAAYEPIVCKAPQCRGVLNPYCMLDLNGKAWICRLCFHRNPLPQQYHQITADTLPLELQQTNTTIEYVLSRNATSPPVFVFVIDTCADEEGLQALKDNILVSLSLLPPDATVGLVTFGTMVHLHEIGYQEAFKSMVFNGGKEYASTKVQEMLGFLTVDSRSTGPNPVTLRVASQYLLPAAQAEYQLTLVLEQLVEDSFAVDRDKRPQRATGTAMNVALSLLEATYPNSASRIMLFTSGACTTGPGLIVERELKKPIRSHHDIVEETDDAKNFKKSCKYFEVLSKRASKNGSIVDIFAGCYDQVGLEEMKHMANDTGGVMVLVDAFNTSIFKQSYLRLFDKDADGFLKMAFLANFEVKMSRELKISGMIGPGVGLNNKTAQVAETAIGVGNTSSWRLCGLGPSTTVATFFDISSAQPSGGGPQSGPPQAAIQYLTYYLHSSGSFRLRVTTVCRPMAVAGGPDVKQTFDQEAAVCIMARLAICKAERGLPLHEVSRWIDSTLVKICMHFGEYIKDNAASFRLPPQWTMFPQFVYHLRRSQLMQVFNNSPDETAYIRHIFNREDTNNCLIMVQPSLTAYELDKEPEPVLLDSVSVTADRVLLLDTFFHILIYHGETIAAWRKAGYQEQDDYANLKTLLEAPRLDAAEILRDRFPLPRFIDTEKDGSQARFLYSRLNPSKQTGFGGSLSYSSVLTDDVSLEEFMDYLINLSVSSKSKK